MDQKHERPPANPSMWDPVARQCRETTPAPPDAAGPKKTGASGAAAKLFGGLYDDSPLRPGLPGAHLPAPAAPPGDDLMSKVPGRIKIPGVYGPAAFNPLESLVVSGFNTAGAAMTESGDRAAVAQRGPYEVAGNKMAADAQKSRQGAETLVAADRDKNEQQKKDAEPKPKGPLDLLFDAIFADQQAQRPR